NADTAMYRAKEKGGSHYQFYTRDMNEKAVERLALETGLRKALERDELVLNYQPLAESSTGRIVAAEALIRWKHPDLGFVSPAEFIPLAEETGVIAPIGEWVLLTA
ncbi:EAL domain-containing protein, partial [Frankia sp. Cpl3]|nr:EAL domain-containing protein [Frankia sp. Cpl3]